jgi:hypothetical protein
MERLAHVVVGAEIEPFHAFVDAVHGREDQHGQGGVACAQAAQHFQPPHSRQAEIENQEVERLHRQRGIGLASALDVIDGIARLAE